MKFIFYSCTPSPLGGKEKETLHYFFVVFKRFSFEVIFVRLIFGFADYKKCNRWHAIEKCIMACLGTAWINQFGSLFGLTIRNGTSGEYRCFCCDNRSKISSKYSILKFQNKFLRNLSRIFSSDLIHKL